MSAAVRWGVLAVLGGLLGCTPPLDRPVGRGSVEPDGVLAGGVREIWINEVMAQNQASWQDEVGSHPDWIELWNPNDVEVDLSGWWMSDDVDDPFDWQIPEGVKIAPNEHLVVACDGDEGDGLLHASFHLAGEGGEDVALFGPNLLDNPVVDLVEDIAPQLADVSLARVPDGGDTWSPDETPSPGAPNEP